MEIRAPKLANFCKEMYTYGGWFLCKNWQFWGPIIPQVCNKTLMKICKFAKFSMKNWSMGVIIMKDTKNCHCCVTSSKWYIVSVLFSLHALLIFRSHYTHFMRSSWITASNFTRNILSTVCNYRHVITHIFVYLHVRCVDAACNVHVVHALYTYVMLQSLWPVLYILFRQSMASVPESGISQDALPQVTCIIAFSKGFICSGGAGTVHLFEKTEEKDFYKKAREIKIPVDTQSPDLHVSESQEIVNLTVSPSEETLVCSTKSSQLYCITMSTADLGKVRNAWYAYYTCATYLFSVVAFDMLLTVRYIKECAVTCKCTPRLSLRFDSPV